MVAQKFAKRLTKGKRFNEIFHIMLEHRLPTLLRDIGATAKPDDEAKEEQPGRPLSDGAKAIHPAVRIRRMMEDLGPTFIKIGQLLGTRPDLIPKEYVDEFKKMYDQTQPTPFPDVQRLVEGELGKPLRTLFESFDQAPIASASIAQVHRAKLRGGPVVAVKVQHPRIEERMQLDFEILRGILLFTERFFAATQVWQPVKHVEEVRNMLGKELDFRHELRISNLMEANFADWPEVKIPHVYAEYSTQRVLVMEFVEGAKFHERGRLRLTDKDQRELARVITHSMAKQIFIDRLFHADPSPGNVLVLNGREVCFLDFGAVGQVTKRRAHLIFEFIQAMTAGNLEETARVIVEMCEVRKEYDPKQFLYDLERILEYLESERATIADPELLDRIIRLANAHGMLLPPDFMLITRALYQFDGMCKELDPEYDIMEVLMPFIRQTLRERFLSPEVHGEALAGVAQDFAKLATRLPLHVERLFTRLEKGQITTRLELQGLEDFKRHRASVQYFLAFTLLLGFSVMGMALAYATGGLDGFRVAAFVSLAALLGWLLVVVILSQRLQRRSW